MSSVAASSPRRCRALAAGFVAAAVLAGCGSTVQTTGTGTLAGTAADGGLVVTAPDGTVLTAPGTTSLPGATSTGTTSVGGTVAPAGSAGSTAVGTPGAPGTAATGAAVQGAAAAVPAKGRGWDEKNVYFGVVTQNDAQQAFASFGADNIDGGDTLGQANAVAAYVNSHGGILGRKLVIRTKDVATVDTATNPEPTGSRVCTYFKEDQPVIGVLSVVTLMDYPNFRACMAKAKIPLFSSTVKVADDQGSDELAPYFTQTLAASWTRFTPVFVQRLAAQGYFSGWNVRTGTAAAGKAKVGVLADSTPAGLRIAKGLQAAVRAAGYDAVTYNYVNASDGQSNSVNYFNQNGVTHVVVTDVELQAFENSAQSQAYKPRYGVNSYNALYTNVEASALTPEGANTGAIGVGWAPTLDVGEANDPGPTPGKAACNKIMAAGGQKLSGKRLAQASAYSLCDTLQLVAQGANAARSFTGTTLASGIYSVASTFPSAVAYSTALSAQRHFVPGTVRDLSYVSACSCFRYGSGTARM